MYKFSISQSKSMVDVCLLFFTNSTDSLSDEEEAPALQISEYNKCSFSELHCRFFIQRNEHWPLKNCSERLIYLGITQQCASSSASRAAGSLSPPEVFSPASAIGSVCAGKVGRWRRSSAPWRLRHP